MSEQDLKQWITDAVRKSIDLCGFYDGDSMFSVTIDVCTDSFRKHFWKIDRNLFNQKDLLENIYMGYDPVNNCDKKQDGYNMLLGGPECDVKKKEVKNKFSSITATNVYIHDIDDNLFACVVDGTCKAKLDHDKERDITFHRALTIKCLPEKFVILNDNLFLRETKYTCQRVEKKA